jgi:hypothetical protein
LRQFQSDAKEDRRRPTRQSSKGGAVGKDQNDLSAPELMRRFQYLDPKFQKGRQRLKIILGIFWFNFSMHDVVMRDTDQVSTPFSVRPRQINEADIPEVVSLLTRGFGRERSRGFWENVLAGLGRRRVPAGFPRYGYVIESDGRLVGVLLMIFSTVWRDETAFIRCNGSSLYVDPSFRIYAPLLTSRQFKDKSVTVLNVTAARYTYKMVEASGFAKYSNGVFIAVPVFSRTPMNTVRVIDAHDKPDAPFNPHDRELLLEHAGFGCTSLWCVTNEKAYPFVFRSRWFKHVPCAQLIYSSGVEDFVRFARPIGLYLASKLQLLVILDANGPVPGLVGKYLGKWPRYFRGPDRPQAGDLAYTETALFGI